MTNMEFFTKLDNEILPKPWRADQRPLKHQIIDFANEKGFTLSGDVTIATDGWVTASIRVSFPAGMTFNGRDFTICDISRESQDWAWITINRVMNDVLTANKGAN